MSLAIGASKRATAGVASARRAQPCNCPYATARRDVSTQVCSGRRARCSAAPSLRSCLPLSRARLPGCGSAVGRSNDARIDCGSVGTARACGSKCVSWVSRSRGLRSLGPGTLSGLTRLRGDSAVGRGDAVWRQCWWYRGRPALSQRESLTSGPSMEPPLIWLYSIGGLGDKTRAIQSLDLEYLIAGTRGWGSQGSIENVRG